MEKRIELKFPKTLTRLTDNTYGKEIFREQVSEKIDYNGINTIVFPNEIKKASSSFVQGFFTDIINKIGYEELDKYIVIESEQQSLKDSIRKNLF